MEHSPALLVATVCIAASYLLLAWQRRLPAATWVGSLVVMLGLVHAAVWNYPGVVGQPWLAAMLALLTHSTLAATASLLLSRMEPIAARREARAGDVRRVLSTPLGDSAVLSSVLTLAVLPFVSWSSPASLAGCLYWLAAIWLAIGWRRRNALLFAAHQLVLTLATGVATAAWLKHQSWLAALARPPAASLQLASVRRSVGRALAPVDRRPNRHFAATRRPTNCSTRSRRPLTGSCGTACRRAIGIGCSSFCYWAWAKNLMGGLRFSPACHRRNRCSAAAGLGFCWASWPPCCWWPSGSAGQRRTRKLAAAGRHRAVPGGRPLCRRPGRGVGAAMGLAGCFLVVSAAIWGRHGCQRSAARPACASISIATGTWIAHGVSLATTALPILALTIVAAFCQFAGAKPGGPAANTFFQRLGPSISYLVPLAIVILCMVGHALRESSSGYAFSAGLVAELAVALGYSLSVVLAPRPFGTAELVTLLQLVTITAAAWMLAWLAARRWVNVWREEPGTAPHRRRRPRSCTCNSP